MCRTQALSPDEQMKEQMKLLSTLRSRCTWADDEGPFATLKALGNPEWLLERRSGITVFNCCKSPTFSTYPTKVSASLVACQTEHKNSGQGETFMVGASACPTLPAEGTPLGTVTALGLEGRGKAPEIKPMGFLVKYDPPTIILEYAATQMQAQPPQQAQPERRGSKGRMRLAEAIAGSKNLEDDNCQHTTEQFFRLQIRPSRGWFTSTNEKEVVRDARRIAVKLQRRYDRFMGKDKVKVEQIAAIVQKLIQNVPESAKPHKKLKWSDEKGQELCEFRIFVSSPHECEEKREYSEEARLARKKHRYDMTRHLEEDRESVGISSPEPNTDSDTNTIEPANSPTKKLNLGASNKRERSPKKEHSRQTGRVSTMNSSIVPKSPNQAQATVEDEQQPEQEKPVPDQLCLGKKPKQTKRQQKDSAASNSGNKKPGPLVCAPLLSDCHKPTGHAKLRMWKSQWANEDKRAPTSLPRPIGISAI